MNYYEHHIGDYAEATSHLSFLEDAAYSRLLRKYYATEKPLPANVAAVQRLIGARSEDERDAVETVLREFFELSEDGWHNKRCDEEIAHYKTKQAKAKRSADARWNKTDSQCDGNANAMRTQCDGNAHQTPDTRHQIEPNPPSLRDVPPAGSEKQKSVTFQTWLAGIKANGEKAVSDYDPVWEYASLTGIPDDWIEIAWLRFKGRYLGDEKAKRKRYSDWRGVFLRAVKENWLGLWFFSEKTKSFCLTTIGVCADIDTREAA